MSVTNKLCLLLLINTLAIAAPGEAGECKPLGLTLCPQPYDAVLPAPEQMLSWSQDERVIGFRNTYRQYAGDVFSPLGANPHPLPKSDKPLVEIQYSVAGQAFSLSQYLARQSVSGLLVLKNGKIAYEHYAKGNSASTLWTSRSVAKSIVTVLIGIAIKEGKIGSVHDPITQYIPELKDTAWQAVSLHQLMQHTSGVAWDEDYASANSDFFRLNQCEAMPNAYDCVLELVKSVKRQPGVSPGELWSYNTGGAWLVGLLLEKATDMTIAKYLESRVWSRYGMEREGVWEALVKDKVNMGGHGFNASLRDWGRFGQFVVDGGKLANGEQLLAPDWLQRSTRWTKAQGSITDFAPEGQYGYQWWFNGLSPDIKAEPKATLSSDQTFWAFGIYGQFIAINPLEQLVVVQWSTWQQAETPSSLYEEQALMVNAVSNALAGPY